MTDYWKNGIGPVREPTQEDMDRLLEMAKQDKGYREPFAIVPKWVFDELANARKLPD